METLTEQNGKTDAFQIEDCLETIQQNFKCTDKTEWISTQFEEAIHFTFTKIF